jgi:hypothetical protein
VVEFRVKVSKEFAAVAYGTLVRRAQMSAIYRFCTTSYLFRSSADEFLGLTAKDIVQAALASGDFKTVQTAFQCKDLDGRVKSILKQMQIATREVEGTPAERSSFRFRFLALRMWSGCSALFFTLNPHDIKSPLLLVFIGPENSGCERISLDWNDGEMEKYYSECLKGNPLRLHELAVKFPDAASRCVHAAFKMTLEMLCNCVPSANTGNKVPFDLIPARCEPGIFGYVMAYFGAVEPQMRLSG